MLKMGYKKIDGKFEQELHFTERMKGIVALYSAITQTDLSQCTFNSLYLTFSWSEKSLRHFIWVDIYYKVTQLETKENISRTS